jgi:MFS family permease
VVNHDPIRAAHAGAAQRSAPALPPGTSPAWRGLAGLLVALTCVLSANRLLLVAVPRLVLTSTGSATQTGLVTMCQVVPYVVMQTVTGPLLDRVPPRRLGAVGDLISTVAVAVLAVAGTPPPWLIMLAMAVVGAADGPSAAAKSILLPLATRAAHQPLERGTGLVIAVERTATAVGPALAGLLIAEFSGSRTLWLAAALFGIASLVSAHALTDSPTPRRTDGYLRQLRQGAAFLRTDTSLRALVVMFAVTNFLDQALLVVLLPVWARAGGHGAAVVGMAISAFAAAAAASALIAAWIGHRFPRRLTYLTGFVLSGVSRFVALATGLPPAAVLAVFTAAGLGSGLVNPIVEAVQYERIPEELRGRVRTLITAWAWIGIPFGGLAGAGLIAVAGPVAALWVCASGYLAAVVYPGWRVGWTDRGPAR